MWAKLDEDIVWENNDVELLGVTIDNNLRHLFKDKQEVKCLNKSG